ncbi:MAG TPA: ATP synthase F1 subunit epsilon [Myxococcaceae bacterium]|nr:ATP synthase F1 subunit epsilon [Myxococcaceae bacterium]
MAKLNVEIITPERRVAELAADEVVAPAAEGLYGILPGHSPFLGLLSAGPLTVRSGGNTEAWFVSGGFVEVNVDRVRVLPDQVEPLAELDVEGAAARLGEAEQRLKALPADAEGRPQAEAAVRRERARLHTARTRR